MMTPRATLFASLTIAAVCIAQEAPPGPAPQLQKLAPLAGTWEGSGTAIMEPGQAGMSWTSKTSCEWVLGGHFLREDAVIEFEGGAYGPLVFRSFHGWDRENNKYRTLAAGNMGNVKATDLHWTEDGKMVQVDVTIENGQVAVDRWVTQIRGDQMSFTDHRAVGDSDFFVHVKGKARRISKDASDVLPDNVAAMVTGDAIEHMKRLENVTGTYAVKGSMVPVAGAPKIQISGIDTCNLIFGGTILEMRTVGDPIPELPGPNYEAFAYLAWDPAKDCHTSFTLSNMGELHVQECHWIDNKLVFTGATMMFGQPMLGRAVIETGSDGAIKAVTADHIAGSNAPARVFEASYTKQKKANKK